MASRQTNLQSSSSSSYAEKHDGSFAPSAAIKPARDSDVTPAVPAGVIIKLLGFTLAMIAAPIGMYFLTVDTIFQGNSTFAGVAAAVTANIVLVAYIIVAWREDQEEVQKRQEKKAQ